MKDFNPVQNLYHNISRQTGDSRTEMRWNDPVVIDVIFYIFLTSWVLGIHMEHEILTL